MSKDSDPLLAISSLVSNEGSTTIIHEGCIQKHRTGWAFLGWILIIGGAWFLFQGFAHYKDGTNPDIAAALESMNRVAIAANSLRELRGEPMWQNSPPVDMMAEAKKYGLIGSVLSIVGLGLALGTSIFRCSECGGKVALKTAKLCPSCGTAFVARS